MYSILLAAVIAFVAWIVQRALHRSDEQRRVASRLRAYLVFWQKRAAASGAWQVIRLGEEWYAEDQAAMKAAGAGDALGKRLVEIDNKYQATLREQLTAELAKEPSELPTELKTMLENVGDQVQDFRKEAIGQALQTRKELMEGHAFVSDSDVSVLDVSTVARTVELRLTLAGLLEDLVGIFQFVSLPDAKMIAPMRAQIISAVLAGIRAGYAIKYLMNRCEFYLNRGRIAAIRENLFV